jgi:sigma-E factor negative regulatory protein RseC
MATESGVVVKTGEGKAWIKTVKTASCQGCSARHGCHTMGGGKEMEMEAINTVGAKPGDNVVVSFEGASLLKLSFLVYLFPILCLIAGAAVGQQMAPSYGIDASFLSVGFSILFFLVSFFVVRLVGNQLSLKEHYRPRVLRVRYRQPGAKEDEEPEPICPDKQE